jgi:protease-4
MDPAKVRTLADGRAFTGRQALAAGLVDEIGGEAEAITWLQSQRHLPADLPVTDVLKGTWIQRMAATSLSSVVVAAKDALRVDGVWAVWQPSLDR